MSEEKHFFLFICSVLFIPCKHNFLCSTLPAYTGPGLVPGEPSNISVLTNLDQERKVSPVIELSILGYIQDLDFPQSHLVIHMVFSLSFCSSYLTSVPYQPPVHSRFHLP